MAEPNDDPLLREIQEELRQEQAKKIWSAYGKYIIAVAVLVVAVVAGYQGWQAYDRTQRQEATDQLIGAANLAREGDAAAAISIFEQIEGSSPADIALLAKVRRAGLLGSEGNHTAAADTYMSVANDASAPKPFRDLAAVLGAVQMLEADAGQAQAVIDQLAALREGNSPWRFSARETSAMAALENGQTDQALEWLQANALDPQAPGGVRSRAEQLLQVIEP